MDHHISGVKRGRTIVLSPSSADSDVDEGFDGPRKAARPLAAEAGDGARVVSSKRASSSSLLSRASSADASKLVGPGMPSSNFNDGIDDDDETADVDRVAAVTSSRGKGVATALPAGGDGVEGSRDDEMNAPASAGAGAVATSRGSATRSSSSSGDAPGLSAATPASTSGRASGADKGSIASDVHIVLKRVRELVKLAQAEATASVGKPKTLTGTRHSCVHAGDQTTVEHGQVAQHP